VTEDELRRIRAAERAAGFDEGYAAAEEELLPCQGVDRVVFPRDRPQFAACVLYENRLLEYHGRVLSWHESDVVDEQRAREHVRELRAEVPELVAAAAARGSNRVASTVRRLAAGVATRSRLQEAQDAAKEAWETLDAHERLARRLAGELGAARVWLDEHVDEASARGRACGPATRDRSVVWRDVVADRSDFVAADRAGARGCNVAG
jgi:hypothetical protein